MKIPLFYWSERKFLFKDKENYGDLLSKYLVEKISGRVVKWVHPKKQPWFKLNKKHFLAIGSIIHHATENSIIWGSGIIDRKQKVVDADFKAVRGPETRRYLLEMGYACPEVYGDPAILLPIYFKPQVEKLYKLGIIPHYNDFVKVKEMYKDQPGIVVLDLMTLDVEEVTKNILECEKTISSSLHGLIVSHAYNIPCVWVKFSDNIFGDGIKYIDYLKSVAIDSYQPVNLVKDRSPEEIFKIFKDQLSLPEKQTLVDLQKGLLASCPFLKMGKE